LGIHEGENVETNTDLQPKKSLSRKRQLMRNEEIITSICKNNWHPFERVNPKLLEKAMQKSTKQRINNYGEALL